MNKEELDKSTPQSNMITKTIKLRLYPTTELYDRFKQLSGNERWIWNHCVAFNQMYHALYPDADALDKYCLNLLLPVWKRMHPWLKLNDSTGLQKTVEQFATSLKNMLKYYKALKHGEHPRKVGFPRFRSWKHDLHGFSGKNSMGYVKVVDINHIKLPKFKQPIRVNSTKELAGWKIKEYRVKQIGDQTYEINLFVEGESQALKHSGKIVGVDCNLKNLITLSNGKTFPIISGHYEWSLKHKQRVYQRKMSRAYDRAKQLIAQDEHDQVLNPRTLEDFPNYWKYRRLYNVFTLKIKRIKRHYYNQVANYLVQNYDLIVFEKLNISGMVKNHHVAEKIQDVSWGLLRIMVEYKCLWNNKLCLTVSSFYTTQECHHCHFTHGKDDDPSQEINLSQRSWKCPRCGHTLRRDQNAAINIKQRFLDDPQKYFKQIIKRKELHNPRKLANDRNARLWLQNVETYSSIFTK